MKTVAVQVGDEVREVQIQPGTTVRDLLEFLQLPDTYLISPAGSSMPFATDGESLYDAVNDGQKLRATVPANVGPLR
jgi:sulfur carrier protein ThiS